MCMFISQTDCCSWEHTSKGFQLFPVLFSTAPQTHRVSRAAGPSPPPFSLSHLYLHLSLLFSCSYFWLLSGYINVSCQASSLYHLTIFFHYYTHTFSLCLSPILFPKILLGRAFICETAETLIFPASILTHTYPWEIPHCILTQHLSADHRYTTANIIFIQIYKPI